MNLKRSCVTTKKIFKDLAKFRKFMEAYCVKCRAKKEMKNGKEVEMKRKGGKKGRAMKGECPSCGTAMFRILPSK